MQNRSLLPEIGDRRIRSAFLWLPKRIFYQTRFLVQAAWIEEFGHPGFGLPKYLEWTPVQWLDDTSDYVMALVGQRVPATSGRPRMGNARYA